MSKEKKSGMLTFLASLAMTIYLVFVYVRDGLAGRNVIMQGFGLAFLLFMLATATVKINHPAKKEKKGWEE